MNRIFLDILLAVLAVNLPILAANAIALIKKAAESAAASTECTKAQGYIREIAEAVSEAVAATSQTYVDALKKKGVFDKAAQDDALNMAVGAALDMLPKDMDDLMSAMFEDVQGYLEIEIEAEVRRQKTGGSVGER